MSPPTREREITLTGRELSAINSLVLQTSQRSHQTSSASHCWSQRNSGFAWLSQKITLQTTLLPFSVKVIYFYFFTSIPSIYWLSFYFIDICNIICKLFVFLPTQERSGLLSFWSKLLCCRLFFVSPCTKVEKVCQSIRIMYRNLPCLPLRCVLLGMIYSKWWQHAISPKK